MVNEKAAEQRKTRVGLSGSTIKKNAKVMNRAEQSGVAEITGSTVSKQGVLTNQAFQGDATIDGIIMQTRSNFFNQAVGNNAAAEAKELEIGEDVIVENRATSNSEEQAQPPTSFCQDAKAAADLAPHVIGSANLPTAAPLSGEDGSSNNPFLLASMSHVNIGKGAKVSNLSVQGTLNHTQAGDISLLGNIESGRDVRIGHIFNIQPGATREEILGALQIFWEQLVIHMADNASELRASLLHELHTFLQTPHARQLPEYMHTQVQNLAYTPAEDKQAISELLLLQRLQNSLRAYYSGYTHLERLFDNTKTPIAESFINLALIKETEYKVKEQRLARSDLEEKDEEKNDNGGRQQPRDYIDERMASHEQLYVVKEPLELTELFEPKDDTQISNKILILGRAGIGKSILCQYLATQWAFESKEETSVGDCLREKFDAVFWLKLRELADKTKAGDTLIDMIDEFCLQGFKKDKPTKEELANYIEEHSHKVLFILDGYDEISDRIDQPGYAHLSRLLGEITVHRNVLLTSRPIAIDALGSRRIRFDRRLENMGFLNENIEAYVEKFMRVAKAPEKAAPMLQFLKSHPGVWGIAHIPINLELLSWLWSKGELAFAQGEIVTLSKLYQTIVDRVQDAYSEKVQQQNDGRENKEENGDRGNKINTFLEYLAYQAMQTETLFIPKRDLKIALEKTLVKYQLPTDRAQQEKLLKAATNKLGFLRATGEGGKSHLDQDHYFIHLSFQEFYAAKHVTRLLSEQPLSKEAQAISQLICIEKYTPRYQLMLWMSAGLLYQHGRKSQQFLPLENFWRAIFSQPRDLVGFHHIVLIMHCLEECEADSQLALHERLIKQQWEWFQRDTSESWHQGPLQHYQEEQWHRMYIEQLIQCPVLVTSKPMITNFLQVLNGPNDHLRKKAAQVFSKVSPDNQVIQVLLGILYDKNQNVRQAVVEALGNLHNPDRNIMNALLKACEDKADNVKKAAIEALGKIDNSNEDVIRMLLHASQDKAWDVKTAAAKSLGELKNPNELAIPFLIGILKEKNDTCDVRKVAVEALGKLINLSKDKTVIEESLLHASRDEENDVKKAAIEGLGKLNSSSEAVIEALLHASRAGLDKLNNSDEAVIEILSNASQDEKSIQVSKLKKESSKRRAVVDKKIKEAYIREAAAEVLGKLSNSSEAVIQALLVVLKDKEWSIRPAAAKALGNLNNATEAVIHGLLIALQSEDVEYRESLALLTTLMSRAPSRKYKIEQDMLRTLEWTERRVREAAAEALEKLASLNESATRALLSVLQHEKKPVRQAAAKALGKLANSNNFAKQALLNALQNGEEIAKQTSIEALGNLNNLTDELVERFLNVLQVASQAERVDLGRAASRALHKLKNPSDRVIRILLKGLQDKDWRVRGIIASVLGKLNNPEEKVIIALLNVLRDENTDVVQMTIKALVEIHGYGGKKWKLPEGYSFDEGAIQVLLNTLQDKDKNLRLTVALMLIKYHPSESVIQVLQSFLQDENFVVRRRVALSLGRMNDPNEKVIEILLSSLQQEDRGAVEALSQLRTTRSMVMLFERLIGTQQGSDYFSFWFEKNYLLCIDCAKREVLARSDSRQAYHIPLSMEHLRDLEEQLITLAKDKNCSLELYTPLECASAHEEKGILQLENVENLQNQGSQLADSKEETPPAGNVTPARPASSQKNYLLYGLGLFGVFAVAGLAVKWRNHATSTNSQTNLRN